MQWKTDDEAEEVAFLPHLSNHKLKENHCLLNHIPVMNGKPHSFSMLFERNASNMQSHRDRNINADSDENMDHMSSNNLLSPASTPSTTRMDDVDAVQTLDDRAFANDALSSSTKLVSLRNPLKLTSQHTKKHLITENDENIISDELVGFANGPELDSIHLNDHDSLSPQTTR